MTEQEMPRYQCHKKVRALKIGSIEHKPNPDQSGKSGSSSYGNNLCHCWLRLSVKRDIS